MFNPKHLLSRDLFRTCCFSCAVHDSTHSRKNENTQTHILLNHFLIGFTCQYPTEPNSSLSNDH